jgi:hypothetical protein
VPVQIQPEPPEEIRAALVRLLAAEVEGRGSASPWWLEGLRESVEDAAGYGETAAPPRRSRGATPA